MRLSDRGPGRALVRGCNRCDDDFGAGVVGDLRGASHSPAVVAPATTAIALTLFWDAAEAAAVHAGSARMA